MSQLGGVPDTLFQPWGRALLIGSFSLALVQAIRHEEELSDAFEGLAIGLVALVFYRDGGALLGSLSKELQSYLHRVGDGVDLKQYLLGLIQQSAATPVGGKPVTGGVNLPALTEQVWRMGVWGVLTTIVDWLFLLAQVLLEAAHAVLWKLLLLLYPLSCGVYPLSPRMLGNLSLYAVELSLWLPILLLIQIATSEVARGSIGSSGGLGLQVVAIELMATLLILSVPAVTHRFLSGAFSGDLGTGAHVLGKSQGWIQKIKAWRSERGGR
jgi:hypothetical protein